MSSELKFTILAGVISGRLFLTVTVTGITMLFFSLSLVVNDTLNLYVPLTSFWPSFTTSTFWVSFCFTVPSAGLSENTLSQAGFLLIAEMVHETLSPSDS